jgi:anti-sigma regulatory factor (Ser/Thr protein kinase)
MIRTFKRNIDSLEKIFDFIEEFFRAGALAEFNRYPISFAIEELFTNMVKYNPGSTQDIQLQLQHDGRTIKIDIVDYTEIAFDVTQYQDVDITKPLEERKPGGLGIHLTRKIMDEIHYKFTNGESRTTLIKYLENKNV